MDSFSIGTLTSEPVLDADLEALLQRAFVDAGFTEPTVAAKAFRAADIRTRGEVLVAVGLRKQLHGMIVAVPSGSHACGFAGVAEAELQLLCVEPDQRARGIGSALVEAAIAVARNGGAKRMILWTQPSMEKAQRLYARLGFERVPDLDFSRGERSFLVYARSI